MEFWVLILTLWAFYVWVQSRIRRQKEDERFANVINALNRLEPRLSDLKKLETRVAELEHRLASPPPAVPAAEQKPAGSLAPPSLAPKPVELPPPAPPAAEVPKSPAPPAAPPVVHRIEPILPHKVEPPAPPPPAPATSAPAGTQRPVTPPSTPAPAPPRPIPPPLSPPPKPASISAREATSQFEELLGKNWLSKIGIVAIVIGVAYFLGAEFHKLSNPAKIALCYLVSGLILGTGVYLERLDRYRVFARALIGGGWALVFFVTFAMHFVPYTRVIDTQWVDLVLLFVVAAVMVVHTLRYDSQVVTGLAFLLAFTTVAISQNTIYSLSAGAILALGLVIIVHRRQWFELEVFGILASYGNHFLWLANVIVPANGHHRLFPEFVPSTVLLALYWAIYRWSYIARHIKTPAQETLSTFAAILNTSLLLALFKYQSVRPELAFYALLLLGAVELALGQLPVTRQRRIAFTILSAIGVILLVAAIPFKYSGMDTAVIWLAEAQMLFFAGVFSREVLFRVFGMLVAVLTSADMLVNQALPKLYDRLSLPSPDILSYLPQSISAPDTQLAISFLIAALFFYADALVVPRRWKGLITAESEETALRVFSYLAGLMLFVSLWLAFPYAWTAVLWVAAAFVLIVLSHSLEVDDLRYQAHLFALAACFRALDVNTFLTAPFLHTSLSLRLVTLSLVIALLYLCARWLVADETSTALAPSELYTTAAAILFVILSYRECGPVWIGPMWGLFALVLAISGYFRGRRDLSLQAHFLVLAGFARTLLFNLDATREWHHFTYRFLTFTLVGALLYFCAYFSGPRDSAYARLFSALHTWCGSILIAVLAFAEVSSPWIAVTWSVFALLLLIIGNRVKRIQLHFQAYLLSISAFAQAVTVNLNDADPFRLIPTLSLRFVTIALIAAIFYLCARWASKGDFPQARLAGAAYTWAASLLIALWMYREFNDYAVALGWAVFALALFELGVWRKSLNFRAQSYVLLSFSFLRLIVFNLDLPPAQLLLYTLPAALVFYYVHLRLWRLGESAQSFMRQQEAHIGSILSYFGSATLVLFSGSYYPGAIRFIAWAVLSLLFIGIAYLTPLEIFLSHSVILAFFVALRTLGYEFQIGGRELHGTFSTTFYVSAVAAILFAGLAFAFPLRSRMAARAGAPGESSTRGEFLAVLSRPEQIYFFLPFGLVTLMILNEVSFGRVTIAWGVEAVVAFLFALIVGERSFRLAGLALLLICVAKITLLDVWRLQGSDRYITLIILGVALVLVSYLYTRYSEAIRRYL
jgi:Predicted membrane protein (DUF2339)